MELSQSLGKPRKKDISEPSFINQYTHNFGATSQRALINRHCSDLAVKAHNKRKEVKRNLQDLPAVFTHVDNSYRKWKQQDDAQTLRKSTKLPRSSWPKSREAAPVTLQARSDSPIESAPVIRLQPDDDVDDSDRPLDDEVEAIIARAHPLTILRKGNSDPFETFAIPIDGRVAYIMNYTRDLYLPAIDANLYPEVSASAWSATALCLRDECTAYNHLARIVAAMPKSPKGSDFAPQLLIFKVKGVALLRRRLMSSKAVVDTRTAASLMLCLLAEVTGGHLEEAACHAKMIARLFRKGSISVDVSLLFRVLNSDMQRTCLAFSRSAFDLDTWVPQQFAPWYSALTAEMPSEVLYEACEKRVDASVAAPIMRSIMTEAAHCLAVFVLTRKDETFAVAKIFVYLRCRVTVCIGRLINHYLDSVALMERDKWQNIDGLRVARVEAYISLAQAYVMRRRAGIDSFRMGDNVTIFNANPQILIRIRELLEQDEWNDEERYGRMKLSALFVGAWAEQAGATSTSHPETEWFNIKLATQAAKMGLRSWEDVREVLLGFNYSDWMQPNGSTWFGNRMSVREAKGDGIKQAELLLLE